MGTYQMIDINATWLVGPIGPVCLYWHWNGEDPEAAICGHSSCYEIMETAEYLHDEYQASRGELAGVAETAECYECCGFDGVHFKVRKIVALGPIGNRADPTQSYKLECGHTTI
jgi:hypothetical protein